MTKTITISKENTAARQLVKALQEEKRRLRDHIIKGGKLDDFKLSISNK